MEMKHKCIFTFLEVTQREYREEQPVTKTQRTDNNMNNDPKKDDRSGVCVEVIV